MPTNFNIPVTQEALNKSKLLLKGFGMQKVQAKFFTPNKDSGVLDQPILGLGSWSGCPVFDNFEILGFNYKEPNNSTPISVEYLFIDTILITVTQVKNIVETTIQGRNGPLFEYISDGAYQIVLRGLLASNLPNTYPAEQMKKLMEVLKAPVSFNINSGFLQNNFAISNIIVKDYNFPQQEGNRSVQLFEINCVNEYDFSDKTI